MRYGSSAFIKLFLFVSLVYFSFPLPSRASKGCQVLLYCIPNDSWFGAPVTNLINVLQNAGAQVTTIGLNESAPGYCPAADNWGNYNQVWDVRFALQSETCPLVAKYADYFDTCWQSQAATYLNNGGSLFLMAEHAGFMSRSQGNSDFFIMTGGVLAGYSDCPGVNGTGVDSSVLGITACTLPGSSGPAGFYGDGLGGLPLSLLNGTSFVQDNLFPDGVVRSVVSGWDESLGQLPGLSGGTGKLFTVWDSSMWVAPSYAGAAVGVTNQFFTAVYQWLGGTACGALTPTPTPTFTPTFTPTLTATPTPTATITPTATPTCVIHVWPDPYSPHWAFDHALRISCLPPGAQVFIYTLSGELVNRVSQSGDPTEWVGAKNFSKARPASPGIYYYAVIQQGQTVLQRGKF